MTRKAALRAGGVLAVVWAAALCPADTIVFQGGVEDYSDANATVLQGSTGATLWEPKNPKPKGGLKGSILYVRGTVAYRGKDAKTGKRTYREASNRVLLMFKLPSELRRKTLARARLLVFVPEARKVRMINEILCREVTQPWTAGANWTHAGNEAKWTTPGGTVDTTTDYKNGRRKGAVDSRAFWEFSGRWFPHKYTFLTCPQGGTWLDFNISPLVEKWLKNPKTNHGVAIEPITQGDKRFLNRIEIDMPSPNSPDVKHRPRLVLDFEPLKTPYRVGMTHGLRKYCDLSPRFRFYGPFKENHEMAMARNEYEPFQVLVCPLGGDLKQVTFEASDLVGPGGAKIPAKDVTYNCQEMVYMHRNGKTRDWYYHGKRYWIPDPLSHPRPLDLRRHMSTPFWFTVRTRPETKPGVYKGTVTVKPENAPPRTLRLTVKVWNYKIPERWNFQTMGQSCWGNYWRAMRPHLDEVTAKQGKEAARTERAKLHRKYIDFLMDHRFMPTQQYSGALSPSLGDIPYCVTERGGNTIYLNGAYRHNERFLNQLRRRCDAILALDKKLRDEGKYTHPETLMDMSLVYIGDETNKWDLMRKTSDAIRLKCPELMIMIGGSFPRKELDGTIDIYDPQVGGGSKTYSLTEQMTGKIAESQGKGERFFWYDAAGPMLPFPNVQCEEPLIASRAVFWMTWKYGVTGFEYYCYAIWSHNFPHKDKKSGRWVRWPEKPFTPWGWGNTNGDGMLFYPGPDGLFSSVRFENVRDGIEDWESHFVLRDYVDAVKKKGVRSAEAKALVAKAERLLAVPDEVVKNLKAWTWEPEVLVRAHHDLGETIDAFAKLVTEKEVLTARLARKTSQLRRPRAMLKARAGKARQAQEAEKKK